MSLDTASPFDEIIDRRGSNSSKWDLMERAFGVPQEDGLAMWIADMDFRAPDFLQDAVKAQLEKANYGYFCGLESFNESVRWWMQERHGWALDTDHMFTTYGLGHGIAMAIQCFTEPEDHVAIFSPVYHEFAIKIGKTGRNLTELPLMQEDGRYTMDFAAYDGMMTGREKMVLFSSPHNPAGRVWTQSELSQLADFCKHHDLILVSDEIHHDLTFPGQTHLPMPVACPEITDRLIITTSASKTFNIAGTRCGCVTIPDPALRERFGRFYRGFDINPNLFGIVLMEAAYSPAGAAWVDELRAYLAGNAALFGEGIAAIPGLSFMPMESTYLSWVDFAGTGMVREEFQRRVFKDARIAATPGHTLGTGGESFLRFNLGMPRARVQEAVERLAAAFGDLQ
ncbi:MalY/PatB family protein [Pseudoruegeria sp. SHC-113]|uniref:MalY/PatB family protein n=1 Tax=Pseudoruegeria sp. SHC-113 TaxID=2855439 RepID=UPI0021BBA7F2|nr:PatB family C-S lyase [Pseudoruegeria sp. SHC-113]MCT8159214.1 PatB family C-S lyase [Pseudoruegeria sp. SHC-113]